MNKFYLTTPIYYINAKPHVGHAYTTVSADVIARYYKQKFDSDKVFLLTGTDEYGAHIAEAAEQAGKDPQQFADEIVPHFKSTWKALSIEPSHFIRTTDPEHKKSAQEFLTTLKKKGVLYEDDYSGLYCSSCESFKTEKELDPEGNCPDHKKPPQKISEKNWFFKLKDHLPTIQKLIESDTITIRPKTRKQEVLGLLKQNLGNFSISRPSVSWGIPVPWDNNQTIYVWVEALLNYWTAIQNQKTTNLWPPDLQIVGKDIIKFHCIYWPALLLAFYDGDTSQLPKKFFAHGFFTINGQKMSKTIGNVIDPNDLVREFGADGARYLLLCQFPFGADGDIEQSKFIEKYNADLANGIGNLVSRTNTLINKKITDTESFWKTVKENHTDPEKLKTYHEHMQSLELFEALQFIMSHVKKEDEYLARHEPWKLTPETDQGKLVEILGVTAAHILTLAEILTPFLPDTAKKITKLINVKEQSVTIGEPLFPRK